MAARPPLAARAQKVAYRVSLSGIRLPLALLIITTVSRVHQYVGLLNKVRPALVLFVWALVAVMLSRPGALAKDTLKQMPTRITLALGAAALLSMPLGISFGGSASFFLNSYSKVIILALLVAVASRTPDDLWTMIWAYVIAVGTLAVLVMTVLHMQSSDTGIARIEDGATYDANDIGLVCVTGLPLALFTLRTSRGFGKLLSVVILGLTCIAIARTGSRGAFLGTVAVAISLLLFARSTSVMMRVSIATVGAVGLMVAAPAGYLKQMQTIINPSKDYNLTTSTGRVEIAKRGIGYLKRNPITGIGLMNFSRAEGTLSAQAKAFEEGGAGVKWSAAHNSFLQATVEMGLVGGGLFVTLIIVGMKSGRRLRRFLAGAPPPESGARVLSFVAEYLPLAFVGFAVCGFFLSFAYMDPLYLLGAYASAALAMAQPRASEPQRRQMRPRPAVNHIRTAST